MSLEVTSKSSWVTCSHEQTVVRCCKFIAGSWTEIGVFRRNNGNWNDDDDERNIQFTRGSIDLRQRWSKLTLMTTSHVGFGLRSPKYGILLTSQTGGCRSLRSVTLVLSVIVDHCEKSLLTIRQKRRNNLNKQHYNAASFSRRQSVTSVLVTASAFAAATAAVAVALYGGAQYSDFLIYSHMPNHEFRC